VAGLERFGPVGLLRSLAVSTGARGRGLGRALVSAIEDEARSSGIADLYLLTTTADEFFSRLGYVRIARDETPVAIASTAQFSALCPSSAVVMRKSMGLSANAATPIGDDR
jgi:amino-acid N-acetyltransferase